MTCADGYQDGSQPACVPCNSNCVTCKTNYNATTLASYQQCKTCSPGLFYDISYASNCIICPGNNYWDPKFKKCFTCTIPKCSKCTSSTQCLICDVGYYIGNLTMYDTANASQGIQTMTCLPNLTYFSLYGAAYKAGVSVIAVGLSILITLT